MISAIKEEALPHWDMSNVFPGLESEEYRENLRQVKEKVAALDAFLDRFESRFDESGVGSAPMNPSDLTELFEGYIEGFNQIELLFDTALVYVYGFVSTDSYDTAARRTLSELQITGLGLSQLDIKFKSILSKTSIDPEFLESFLENDGTIGDHALFIEESIQKSRYLMSEEEETLASELSLSGASAWAKLHGVVNSQIKVDFKKNGQVEQLPITVVRTLYNDSDEAVRRQAYETEIAALEAVREPLAASLNGIKGTVSTLNKRRGRPDYLHSALETSRIERQTLDVMLSAMRDSFPDFRRYLKAKAAYMGKERLPWWDLSAPVGKAELRFSYSEAREFILSHFASFSDDLADYSRRVFDEGWIDAEPRDGKSGGAFCMAFASLEEARILCNFDGSIDSLITLAHELGHAYHDHCLRGKTPIQRSIPMTAAETASIFNQTIITDAALEQAGTAEKLAILENFLYDGTQVVVDIYSRFLFESEVFERRSGAELSADEFCEIMLESQKQTYGDGLDPEYLHPYMWAWKSHYYSPGRSFYNYPYAFGLLFGLGLFNRYKSGDGEFVESYQQLLADSGKFRPAELARRFNIDISQKSFWESGLDFIRERIDLYIAYLNESGNEN